MKKPHAERPRLHVGGQVIKIKKASSNEGSKISHACKSTFPPPNQRSFRSMDFTEGKLESMYLNICLDISSLVSLVCRNWLGCLGYKYVLPCIVKGLSHDQSTNPTFYLQFTFRRLRHFSFLFDEFFRVDQGRLTFERLYLLVSFRLPSKSELYLPDASLWLRSDLFKSYRIIFRL